VDPKVCCELDMLCSYGHRHDGLKLASTAPRHHALPRCFDQAMEAARGRLTAIGTTPAGANGPTYPTKPSAIGIRVVLDLLDEGAAARFAYCPLGRRRTQLLEQESTALESARLRGLNR